MSEVSRRLSSGEKVACIQSQVSNGKTAIVPAISYVAVGVAGVALVMSGVSAAGAAFAGGGAAAGGSVGGMGTISPSFVEVFGWFQGMAMNGMLSVNYPTVYRSFSKNFGFSTGLVPWNQLQMSIDSFRGATGGNLPLHNLPQHPQRPLNRRLRKRIRRPIRKHQRRIPQKPNIIIRHIPSRGISCR